MGVLSLYDALYAHSHFDAKFHEHKVSFFVVVGVGRLPGNKQFSVNAYLELRSRATHQRDGGDTTSTSLLCLSPRLGLPPCGTVQQHICLKVTI